MASVHDLTCCCTMCASIWSGQCNRRALFGKDYGSTVLLSIAGLKSDTRALFIFGVPCVGILLGHFGLLIEESTYLDRANAWRKSRNAELA